MTKSIPIIVLHLTTLLVAASNFTLITALLGHGFHWEFQFLAYNFSNGWGYVYQSDYSLAQVCAFLLAYASGLFVYPRFTHPPILAAIATLCCVAGTLSYGIELSHWVVDHHLTLVGSFPIIVIPIGIWTIVSRIRPKLKW